MSDTNAAGADTNYDWREDLGLLHEFACLEPSAHDRRMRLAAHIESLTAERDALLAEHEACSEIAGWRRGGVRRIRPLDPDWNSDIERLFRAHDHAEEVLGR